VYWCINKSKNVLTSGQCVYNYKDKKIRDPSEFTIVMGSPHRSMLYKSQLESDVTKITMHQKFSDPSTGIDNDVALLKLTNHAPTKMETIKSIVIRNDNNTNGLEGTINGWGELASDYSGYSFSLKKITVKIVTNDKCGNLGVKQNPGTLCVTTTKKGSTCNGDLGDPFIVSGQLVGFVSVETACKNELNQPIIVTSVSHYKKWIDANSSINLKAASLVFLISIVMAVRFF